MGTRMAATRFPRNSLFDVRAGGLDLHVQSMHVWRTYAGLLEGAPDAELNCRIVRSAGERAATLCGGPVVTIPPEILDTPFPGRAPARTSTFPLLPAFTCVAELWCWSTRSEAALASALTVVWFADEVTGGALETTLASAVQEVDWWRHSGDFDI
jgi:hypothetical protein